jgi:hypothetical protein
MVVAPRMSGSTAGRWRAVAAAAFQEPRHDPRAALTGEVVVPLAVTFRTLA